MKTAIAIAAMSLALPLFYGCAAQPIKPGELAAVSDTEVCVAIATTYLTGNSATINGHTADSPTLAAEAYRRGDQCEPKDSYMAIATERQQLAIDKQQADAAKSMALSQALSAAAAAVQAARPPPPPVVVIAAPTPTQTICRPVGSTVQCSSY